MVLLSQIPLPQHNSPTAPLQFHHFCGNSFIYRTNLPKTSSCSLKNGTGFLNNVTPQAKTSLQNPDSSLCPVSDVDLDEESLVSSAIAVSAAIRRVSSSPVEFVQRIEKASKKGLVLPSQEFKRLCVEQLDLFRGIVNRDAVLSIYVRPAGSYVMDRLELRRVALYPRMDLDEQGDIVVLVANFVVSTGLRAAEAGLSNQQVEDIPECRAVVFPMVKDPFLVGFLIAELPMTEARTYMRAHDQSLEESYGLSLCPDGNKLDIQPLEKDLTESYHVFSIEQRSQAVKISRSLAMAYVLDQKTLLLQQSSWQNNIRMSNLVEQIRGPLCSIRTLSKMLSVHMKRNEISYDIVEDILVQGDCMKDTLQKLQDAVYLTKANIVRYNDETLKRMGHSTYGHPDTRYSQSSDMLPRETQDKAYPSKREMDPVSLLGSEIEDLEIPMPPLALAALQKHKIRPCIVSVVVADLVAAAGPLAHKQQRSLKFRDSSQSLQVAVEEAALRQALSNLMEGALLRTNIGGRVDTVLVKAPGGGVLIVIDDNGPDMHYMTQMHSLAPFGADIFSEGMVGDNMTWNFVAGLTVAREILESYGCVVRVISPHLPDAPLGAGGTRVELWLPAFPSNDPAEPTEQR